MLRDLLAVVDGAGLTGACWVVSSDPSALSAARSAGVRTLKEGGDRGVNAAVGLAASRLRGFDSLLVIPADLPSLKRRDLLRCLALSAKGAEVVITPSKEFNGTNLLIYPLGSKFRLSYDANSFWNHVAESARNGLRLAVAASEGLTSDLDTEEDLMSSSLPRINSLTGRFAKRLKMTWGS